MKHFIKYKRLAIKSLISLGILSVVLASTVSVATAAPLDIIAGTPGTPCSLYGPVGGENGVYIADGVSCCPVGTSPVATSCLFTKYVNPIIILLSALVGIVVVIAVIIGAIEFISSGGDPQRVASGKQHITNALIGLFAYILLFAFLQFLIPGGL